MMGDIRYKRKEWISIVNEPFQASLQCFCGKTNLLNGALKNCFAFIWEQQWAYLGIEQRLKSNLALLHEQ